MKNWKIWLPDVVAVVLFAVIAFAYFYPADVENRILFRHDASAGVGAGQEASEFLKQTGERTRWSNSIFGGMPTYQTAPSYDSTDALQTAVKAYHLWLPENVWYVFAYLVGFYILMRVVLTASSSAPGGGASAAGAAKGSAQGNLKVVLLAFLGAIAWAFSSYFFIIIGAGHIWKVMALAYLPPMIAGIVLAYRGKYLWGLVVTAIFAAFEVNANHVQMTYYYLFVVAAMVIAYIVECRKDWRHVLRATCVCVAGALIGICLNLSNLYHTWQYSQETMRGKSELVKADAANQTGSGLDRDYITQWSYGIGETWTLLIPNAKGGASVPIVKDERAMAHADEQVKDFFGQVFQMDPYANFYEYWGSQPMTAGPVYVGAFVLFLFVLGLFVVKGPMKWALLAATVLSVLLSWGKNFMPMTDFFIDFVPMYAKFRTVASILVVAEFTIPLLALLALKRIVDEPQLLKRKARYFYISLALTGGFCLLFALMPRVFFDFNSAMDAQTVDMMNAQIRQVLANHPDVMQQYQGVIGRLLPSLEEMHKAVFVADCWRSLLIILIGVACLLLYGWGKLRAPWLLSALTLLCLVDMWQVDKRYLNDEMFVPKAERENPIKPTYADEQILQDKSLDYRVLNLTTNTFNENETSFFHKSIGGYHAAKLRRYQELIDAYLIPEIDALYKKLPEAGYDLNNMPTDSVIPVLNMLNTKYIILGMSNQPVPLQNYQTYGNAWLVNRVQYVDNANEELDALGQLSLRHEAVADRKFAEVLGESVGQDTLSRVTLDKYQPNQLTYTVQSGKGGVVVFSEIYYPGWTATIDGQEAELGRVNYVLRALKVSAGKHKVVLSFFPRSIHVTETIAYVSYGVLALIILTGIFVSVRKKKGE